MKYCKHCAKDYPDSMNFCTECGAALERKEAEVPPVNVAGGNAPVRRVKKRRPVWKVVLIVLAALVGGFFILLNYLNNVATYLRMEPDHLIAPKVGGSTTVDIDYDGYIWHINHVPDWVDVVEDEDKIGVEVRKNTTGVPREGSITVQSGKCLAQVIITQAGVASYISPSQRVIHFDKGGGSRDVSIDTDGGDYQIDRPDFVSVSEDDDSEISIRTGRNTGEYRSGYVRIKEDGVTASIYVSQGGKCNDCHGSGTQLCPQCMGQGGWGYGMFYTKCWGCDGNGRIKCGTCNGSGERE
ncbi:BACON domain-containing carbohydrate-binding protein [Barnesiella sp. An55]|uniref:BACON domain-containing protein n=1 Tax=Barnesiella sp. An55 TaxID=1965646 RepID=UPI000B39D0BC|nr:BACON domain-containing carbohydrate-binding protein [Barnesiella sp. An55]OUN73624.1 hypothetical protein B5G10_03405 [Barnesiella sp. An55]